MDEHVLSVARIDAGLAVVLTQDMNLLEVPSVLLPSDTVVGSIVKVSMTRCAEREQQRLDRFLELQEEFLSLYYTTADKPSPSSVDK